MPEHSAYFEASGSGLALTHAILLYRARAPGGGYHSYGGRQGDATAFASLHAVEEGEGAQPTIAAGTPLTRAHLRQWAEALGRTARPEILPDNVLIAHSDMLAWWVPERIRPAHFALSAPPPDLRILSARVSVNVPYPAHLLIATGKGLGVYALGKSQRPTADTVLLHSPILNVFIGGQLCWGNIPQPRALDVASIAEFERAVFDSWSTHPNPGQDRTISGKGGLERLWDDLAARRATHFPTKRLKPFGTVGGRGAPHARKSDRVTFGMLVGAGPR